MKPRPTKPIKCIWGFLVLGVYLFAGSLKAQELKPKHRFFIGAGIGACDVVCRQLGRTVGGFGPLFSVVLGLRLSEKSALQLEYIVNHPNDEKPRISDLVVVTTIQNGEAYYRFEVVRSPKVFLTKILLFSFRREIFRDFFYRIGVGLGGNYSSGYYTSKDSVLEAKIEGEGGYALGIAAGHEFRVFDPLTISLEASARWSSGEDSTSARFVFGLGTVVKWDF